MYTRIIAKMLVVILLSIAYPGFSQAGTYYVSPTGSATWTNCSGATPLNGTTACSWQTAMAGAMPGDTVYFREGTYEPGEGPGYNHPAMNPARSGTALARIIFKAYPGETPIIKESTRSDSPSGTTASIGIYQRDYITWDGFTLVRDKDNGIQAIALIWIETANYGEIVNCDISGRPHRDQYNGGLIHILNSTSYISIHNNRLHGMSCASDTLSANCINTTAIWVFGRDNTYIYNNDIYDNVNAISWKDSPNYVYIYNNHFWNNSRSVINALAQSVGGDSTDFHVHNNLIRNSPFFSSPDAATTWYNLKLYNNTVYNPVASYVTMEGIEIGTSGTNTSRNAEIYNNILSFSNTNARFVSYWNREDKPAVADYNLFYNANGQAVLWRYAGTNYIALSSYVTSTGSTLDTHSITSNPLFVNAGGTSPDDYRLQATSPALNTGIDRQDFDNDGNTTESIDMGAYPRRLGDRIGYRTPQRPAAPGNLMIK